MIEKISAVTALLKTFLSNPVFRTPAFRTGLALVSSLLTILIISNISSITGFFTVPTNQTETQNITVLGGVALSDPRAFGRFGTNRIFLRQEITFNVNAERLGEENIARVYANVLSERDNRTFTFDLSGDPEGGVWAVELRGVEPSGKFRVIFEALDDVGNRSTAVESNFSVFPWPALGGGVGIGY